MNLSTLDGTTGFRLDGAAGYDESGRSVASAGDVNGDGFDDLIVGATGADPNGDSSGSSYIVFGRETVAPMLQSAAVNGATLVLTYDEALDMANLPLASAFAVDAGGAAATVASVAVSGTTVTLTLAAPVASGASVTVSYLDLNPARDDATGVIQDAAGNDAAPLLGQAVTNNTAAPTPPPAPTPAPTGATSGNDVIAAGSSSPVFGLGGADTITAAPAAGTRSEIYGGTGPNNPDDGGDTITVSGQGAASVWGNGGDDTIRYMAEGAAIVYAGVGADTVDVANNAANLVFGGTGAGDAVTVRGDGANTIYGGSFANDSADGADSLLVIGNGANTLFGNGGDDRIEVQGAGPNLVYGGLGGDTIVLTGAGANTVYGGTGAGDVITIRGDGNNVVYGGSFNGDAADGADLIRIEGNGANTVYANGGDDIVVLTGTGANTVYGFGNDTILGGSGADRIIAGQGANVLSGGSGADRFVVGAGEIDFITDFNAAEGDRIETGGQAYTVTQTTEGYAAITLANGSFIVLQGVTPASVTDDIFA